MYEHKAEINIRNDVQSGQAGYRRFSSALRRMDFGDISISLQYDPLETSALDKIVLSTRDPADKAKVDEVTRQLVRYMGKRIVSSVSAN